MGNTSSNIVPNLIAHIHTNSGAVFRFSYLDLVDHILLLRQVISHPKMIEKGEKLNSFINDYCHRMSNNELMSKCQQLKLPWEIDWIWHVHRLHPINYLNDCIKQIPQGYFIDKKTRKLTIDEYKNQNFTIRNEPIVNPSSFVPSLDLVGAVLRQRDFLEKFQKHQFYSMNFKLMNLSSFEQIVQNYISFIKLAKKETMIVPTFDIDFSTTVCGFILNHDDSIHKNLLNVAYQNTANQWKLTYQSEYGQNIDRDRLRNTSYKSSCVMIPTHNEENRSNQDNSSSGGSCGGWWWESSHGHSDSSCGGGGCGCGCGGD